MNKELSFVEKCRIYLNVHWERIQKKITEDEALEFTNKTISGKIKQILTSETKSYHYVLPTQLLAKCVDYSLDIRSLQASFNSKGAFDARTIAHQVIVPFDKSNNNVLGGSNEPYVNNPLRYSGILSEYRNSQKNKEDWDLLVLLLEEIQFSDDVKYCRSFLSQVLLEIYKLLSNVIVSYPTPNRISLDNTIDLITKYVGEKSGGDRLEATVTALLRTIGTRFNLFDKIERAKVNASDTSTGLASDIECWNADNIILGVEVKDKELTITQFDSTVGNARANHISEILFVVEKGINKQEKGEIEKKKQQEFISGQNVYVRDFILFATGILILLGEKGRVEFLQNVGPELERGGSSIIHRKRWAELLRQN